MEHEKYWLKNGFDATIISGTATEIIEYLESQNKE